MPLSRKTNKQTNLTEVSEKSETLENCKPTAGEVFVAGTEFSSGEIKRKSESKCICPHYPLGQSPASPPRSPQGERTSPVELFPFYACFPPVPCFPTLLKMSAHGASAFHFFSILFFLRVETGMQALRAAWKKWLQMRSSIEGRHTVHGHNKEWSFFLQ